MTDKERIEIRKLRAQGVVNNSMCKGRRESKKGVV